MNRQLLDDVLAEVTKLSHGRRLVMIGSQRVHALTVDPPAEVVMSRECDLLVDEHDPLAAVLDQELGPTSRYAAERFVHVDTVSASLPFLPPGFEQRMVPLENP